METLSVNGLKRNPAKIKSLLKVGGNITTALDNLRVIFPERYINRKLAILDQRVQVLSLYAILDDDGNYAVVNAPIIQTVTPSNITDVTVNGKPYKVLHFIKNNVMIPNNTLIMRDNFLYDLFDELFIKGNVPWYLDYNDVASIFLESKKYANSNIGKDPLSFEVLTSIITRDPNDKKIYARQTITPANMDKLKFSYIGLNNPYYSFDNTGAKLIGSRFGDGVNVAIVEPEKKTSATTDILRS